MRSFLKLAVLSALGTASALGAVAGDVLAAPVYTASGSVWDHNGSKVTLEEHGDKRKLVYSQLREGLDKAGIKVGTVLFNGERKADGRLAGFAKIFKGTCNPVDYFVEGTADERKGEIVLQGQAPVYSGQGCEVSGYSDSSPASILKFSKISDAPESAVVAGRQPEQEIEQGDRGPADEYLPPKQRGTTPPDAYRPPSASAAPAPQQDEPQAGAPYRRNPDAQDLPPLQERNRAALPDRNRSAADIDESDPDADYVRPRDRRYGRGPDPYDEPRIYRRRPGIWDPAEDMDPEDRDYYDDDDDRPSPFWGRRRGY